MTPLRTSIAPTHKTPITPLKATKIIIIVINARTLMRAFALSKAFSVTPANSDRLRTSWVKACTVCTDKRDSEALPDEAAIQSWFLRDSPRSLRPNAKIGPRISGTINNTKPVSLGDVQNIITSPPDIINILRKSQLAEDPTTDRIRVVSVVILLSTSPVINFSK